MHVEVGTHYASRRVVSRRSDKDKTTRRADASSELNTKKLQFVKIARKRRGEACSKLTSELKKKASVFRIEVPN